MAISRASCQGSHGIEQPAIREGARVRHYQRWYDSFDAGGGYPIARPNAHRRIWPALKNSRLVSEQTNGNRPYARVRMVGSTVRNRARIQEKCDA